MITILTGMKGETDTLNTFPPMQDITIIQGITARDDMESAVPPNTDDIVCWGLGGGLSPYIKVGDVCISGSVELVDGRRYQAAPTWITSLMRILGPLRSRFVRGYSDPKEQGIDPPSRKMLYDNTKCDITNMGSYAVAEWAAKHNKPWVAIDCVSDDYTMTVPDFSTFVDDAGNIDVPAAIRQIVTNPQNDLLLIQSAIHAERALFGLHQAAILLAVNKWGM